MLKHKETSRALRKLAYELRKLAVPVVTDVMSLINTCFELDCFLEPGSHQ